MLRPLLWLMLAPAAAEPPKVGFSASAFSIPVTCSCWACHDATNCRLSELCSEGNLDGSAAVEPLGKSSPNRFTYAFVYGQPPSDRTGIYNHAEANMLTMMMVAVYSLRRAGAAYPITVALGDSTSARAAATFEQLKLRTLQLPRTAHHTTLGHGAHTFIKLALFSMTTFDRVTFLDTDTLVLCNLDRLFEIKMHGAAFAAVAQNVDPVRNGKQEVLHNSGLMVVTPNQSLFEQMMRALPDAKPIPQLGQWGDQEFTFHFFTYLQPSTFIELPGCVNRLKWSETQLTDRNSHRLPGDACVWHYIGTKPINCAHSQLDCASWKFHDPFLYRAWEAMYEDMCKVYNCTGLEKAPSASLSTPASSRTKRHGLGRTAAGDGRSVKG
jgi:hypothetical protein